MKDACKVVAILYDKLEKEIVDALRSLFLFMFYSPNSFFTSKQGQALLANSL
mgnify:CR=1 FL=1